MEPGISVLVELMFHTSIDYLNHADFFFFKTNVIQIFELVNKDGKWVYAPKEHNYILQPVTGNAKYTKLRLDESKNTRQALQQATVQLDDVTLSLAKVHLHVIFNFQIH